MRLLALAGLLSLAVAAHADIYPGNYSVGINGNVPSGARGGYLTNAFISILGVGVVPFGASLSPTTVQFSIGTQVYGLPNDNFIVNSVNFRGNPIVPDRITSFTLEPSSTLTGVVPSTHVVTGLPSLFANTFIDFDFTKANILPGETATFDLTFASQASAPEIDPSLAASGLILLAGAVAVLRSRRSRPQATPCS